MSLQDNGAVKNQNQPRFSFQTVFLEARDVKEIFSNVAIAKYGGITAAGNYLGLTNRTCCVPVFSNFPRELENELQQAISLWEISQTCASICL